METNNTDALNLIIKAIDLRDSGKYRESIENLKQVGSDYDTQKEVAFELAKTYLRMGKLQQAKQYAEKTISIAPDTEGISALMGEIYFLEKNNEEARKHFEKVVELEPGNILASQSLLIIYDDSHDFKAEHDLYIKIWQHFNNDPKFLYSYSVFMIDRSPKRDKKFINEALGLLEILQTMGFKKEDLEYYLAKANFFLNKHDKCILHLNNYLKSRRSNNNSAQRYMILIKSEEETSLFYKKHVSDLEKNGDKIFVKPFDKSEAPLREFRRGPIIMPGEDFVLSPSIGRIKIV